MLGQELAQILEQHGADFQGFNRQNFSVSSEPNDLISQLNQHDVWVNCIAYTGVDAAEANETEATLVNGYFPGALAHAAKACGAKLIHISTDYVFDGKANTPYKVNAYLNPTSAYGRSKALGEELVTHSGADYAILRTAWLYSAKGRCFPKIVAEKLRDTGSIKVVNDQFGQPTWAKDLAEMVIRVAQEHRDITLLHATSSGVASWADFAREVAISLDMKVDCVQEIASSEFPAVARRPKWSVLDNKASNFEPIGDWRERWQSAAAEVLSRF